MFMKFDPMAFVDNLVYMGAGMFSIFVVIGIIIAVVAILNKATEKKDDKQNDRLIRLSCYYKKLLL